MHLARILRSLSLPVLAIAAGITLACAESATTAPDQPPPVSAAAGARPLTIDDDRNLGCPFGYALAITPGFDSWDVRDYNANDRVCKLIS